MNLNNEYYTCIYQQSDGKVRARSPKSPILNTMSKSVSTQEITNAAKSLLPKLLHNSFSKAILIVA